MFELHTSLTATYSRQRTYHSAKTIEPDSTRQIRPVASHCPADKRFKRHANKDRETFKGKNGHKARLSTEKVNMVMNVLLVRRRHSSTKNAVSSNNAVPAPVHTKRAQLLHETADSAYSALLAASFSTSSTLNRAFFGSFLTLCQTSPCLGSAIAALLNTSAFFSSVPCWHRNL